MYIWLWGAFCLLYLYALYAMLRAEGLVWTPSVESMRNWLCKKKKSIVSIKILLLILFAVALIAMLSGCSAKPVVVENVYGIQIKMSACEITCNDTCESCMLTTETKRQILENNLLVGGKDV